MDEKTPSKFDTLKEGLTSKLFARYEQFSDNEQSIISYCIMASDLQIKGTAAFSPHTDLFAPVQDIVEGIATHSVDWFSFRKDNREKFQLFLPFLWLAMDDLLTKDELRQVRQIVYNEVSGFLKDRTLLADLGEFPCLSYADFSGFDFSNVCFDHIDLRNVELTKARLGGASFFGCNLEGANFTDVQGLTAAQLSTAEDLYQARFDVEHIKQTATPEDLHSLEEKITLSYRQHGKNENEKALLRLADFLDVSSLEWIASPDKIRNLLASGSSLLTRVQQGIQKIVPVVKPTANLEKLKNTPKGTYLEKRLGTSQGKSFFKPAMKETRGGQIESLQQLISPTKKNPVTVEQAVDTFIKVMEAIKAEKNLFPSELEKQVRQLFNDAMLEAMNNPSSSPLLHNT